MRTEQITEYVANDGARFRDADACRKHEQELLLVEPIMARLPRANPSHERYVQHDVESLRKVRRELWELILWKFGKSYPAWTKWNADDVHPVSIVYRVASENRGPICEAWCSLAVYNFDNGREYDQPYFASHPDEAKPM